MLQAKSLMDPRMDENGGDGGGDGGDRPISGADPFQTRLAALSTSSRAIISANEYEYEMGVPDESSEEFADGGRDCSGVCGWARGDSTKETSSRNATEKLI